MKKFLFILSWPVVIYLLASFITLDLWWMMVDVEWRVAYIVASIISLIGISWYINIETPSWLEPKTHEEKVTWIKKYTAELKEELNLYAEVMELQKKIKDFKNNQ